MTRQEALAILKEHGHKLPSLRKIPARKFYIMENNGQDFSPKQEAFFLDLAAEAAGVICAEEFIAETKHYAEIAARMKQASENLRKPRIIFGNIRLVIMGERSRTAGDIAIYGREMGGDFYGRIAIDDGRFFPSQKSSNVITDQLDELDADPAEAAAGHGHATGNCCFCARDLTDPRSVTVGYGPVCADHFGLPWGAAE